MAAYGGIGSLINLLPYALHTSNLPIFVHVELSLAGRYAEREMECLQNVVQHDASEHHREPQQRAEIPLWTGSEFAERLPMRDRNHSSNLLGEGLF